MELVDQSELKTVDISVVIINIIFEKVSEKQMWISFKIFPHKETLPLP